tara:strand:- start:2 stop:295 length:294 start_codon:yes stop_codon:yes gene_type:complete
MTKKKKTEDIIDLKPEKITEEQLTKVQDQVNRINKFQLEIGILESSKHALLHQVGAVQNEISETQAELEKQYGTADVNVQDGTINYSKENGEVNKKD